MVFTRLLVAKHGFYAGSDEGSSKASYDSRFCNIGALIFTGSILGAPYYNYSILGPETLS